MTALDQYNNTATGYTGMVHFTSTGSGTLPANSTLTNGAGTFLATLVTPGSQTVTATDTSNRSISGTSSTILVSGSTPSITLNPLSQSVLANGSVTFTSAATATPNPTVQWYVEAPGGTSFSAIGGATAASLTLNAVSLGQSGSLYEAVFTNAVGSVTTTAATLTCKAYRPSRVTRPTTR